MSQNSELNPPISSANFFKGFVAINLALPLLNSTILPIGLLGGIANYILFLLSVIALLILNLWLLRKAPGFRNWILALVLLNILATILLGSVGFVPILRDLPFFIRMIL